MVATMKGRPEVFREICTAGVPAINNTTSLSNTMSSSTDSTSEETLGNGIMIKKEKPSLQESEVQHTVLPTHN